MCFSASRMCALIISLRCSDICCLSLTLCLFLSSHLVSSRWFNKTLKQNLAIDINYDNENDDDKNIQFVLISTFVVGSPVFMAYFINLRVVENHAMMMVHMFNHFIHDNDDT